MKIDNSNRVYTFTVGSSIVESNPTWLNSEILNFLSTTMNLKDFEILSTSVTPVKLRYSTPSDGYLITVTVNVISD